MSLSIKNEYNHNHHSYLLSGTVPQKTKSFLPLELSQKDKKRITKEAINAITRITPKLEEWSTFNKESLVNFLKLHRKDLSYFAIKKPSDWLLFSQRVLYVVPNSWDGAKTLKRLNHTIKDLDRKQCVKTNRIPKEIWQQMAFSIPPHDLDNSGIMERIRLFLLENKTYPVDSPSEIKSIPIHDLLAWINTCRVRLKTLNLSDIKLDLLLPRLKFVDLCGYSNEKAVMILTKLKDVRHLTCDQFTNLDLANLTDLPNLTNLDISFCDQITDDGYQFLQEQMPKTTIKYQF